jgi:D-serine deaminase-like pyridoxal phosphate-dependent protein
MLNRALIHCIKLRPHVKTHKTLEIGRMQLGKELGKEASERFEGVCTGIVTSTLAEVSFFAAGGFENILYGVPLCVSKIGEMMKMQEKYGSTKLHVLLDSPQALSLLLEALTERRSKAQQATEKGGGEDKEASQQPSGGVEAYLELGVFIKIDCGYHRAGMDPHDLDEIQAMVQTVTEAGAAAGGDGKALLTFSGIYSHSGHSYGAKREDEEQIYSEYIAACLCVGNTDRYTGTHILQNHLYIHTHTHTHRNRLRRSSSHGPCL